MTESFNNSDGKIIVERMIAVIHENRAYLSEIDGAIGDGDHGINMDKGFTLAQKKIDGVEMSMSDALKILGRTLVMEIGGSMGPLYGSLFRKMANTAKDLEEIDAAVLAKMLSVGIDAIYKLGDAKVGDKTMMDTLIPASDAVTKAVADGKSFTETIDLMMAAAEGGWKSTEDMVARVGRASRLGERSRGTVDAGATSCHLLLKSMGGTMKELIQ